MTDYADRKRTKLISDYIIYESKMRDIPLTKENYQILYEYFDGKRIELISELKDIIKKTQTLDQNTSQYLYEKFFTPSTGDLMNQVQVQTRKIIREILEKILTANDESSQYESSLMQYTEKLSNTTSIEDVQQIIGRIIEDTQTMAASNQAILKEFQKAKEQTETLNQQLKQVESQAFTDALTGLHNRRAFDKAIQELVSAFNEQGTVFSIIVIDVDHFKKFNDTYGHQVGDEVLKIVGDTLYKGLKSRDIPCRYGGEEFVVLLPETCLENAEIVAEQLRIRIAVRSLDEIKNEKPVEKITISLGVAEVQTADTPASIVERADRALYLAKESGRNRTRTEKDL